MASVVNRTTKQYLGSVHTPDFDPADWIINPDLSAVEGVPSRYWNIVGDVISEMNQAEKDAVDAQILSNTRDGKIQQQVDDLESVLRQEVRLVVREINLLRQWLMDFKAEVALANNLAQLKTGVAGLADLADRTLEQAKTQLRTDLGS